MIINLLHIQYNKTLYMFNYACLVDYVNNKHGCIFVDGTVAVKKKLPFRSTLKNEKYHPFSTFSKRSFMVFTIIVAFRFYDHFWLFEQQIEEKRIERAESKKRRINKSTCRKTLFYSSFFLLIIYSLSFIQYIYIV